MENGMERDKITYDARGNGDGETVNTITGDHCDRITDYTPIVCCHAGALAAEPGMKQQNYIAAFNPGQSKDGGLGYEEENSPTIRANSSANDPAIAIAPMVIGRKPENGWNQIGYNESGAAYTNDTSSPQGVCKHGIVRRLLPIETERLMGFPDNWTRIPWRGKPAADCPVAPRYKACGNSMCVNCMEWIGRRIQMVEDRIK